MAKQFLMFAAEYKDNIYADIGAMGGRANTPAQQKARRSNLNRKGRPPGALNRNLKELPAWDERLWELRSSHRPRGRVLVRPLDENVYKLRLAGVRIDEISERVKMNEERVYAICRRVADLILALPSH